MSAILLTPKTAAALLKFVKNCDASIPAVLNFANASILEPCASPNPTPERVSSFNVSPALVTALKRPIATALVTDTSPTPKPLRY